MWNSSRREECAEFPIRLALFRFRLLDAVVVAARQSLPTISGCTERAQGSGIEVEYWDAGVAVLG